MKAYLSKYSYTMVKLFINQFAIALFGIALAFASSAAGRNTLLVVTSICSVVFMLFLQYAVMWEVGAKDGISAEARKEKRGLWRGLAIAFGGNLINFVLALLTLFPQDSTLESIGRFISLLLNGMYMGILSQSIGGVRLNTVDWPFFALIVPSLAVCSVAYILGSYNKHATNILIPKNTDVKNNGRPN